MSGPTPRERIENHIRDNYVARRVELGLSWSELADRFEQTDRTSSGRALAAWARQEAEEAGEGGGRRRSPRGRTAAAPDAPNAPRGRGRRPRVTAAGDVDETSTTADVDDQSVETSGSADEDLAAAEGVA